MSFQDLKQLVRQKISLDDYYESYQGAFGNIEIKEENEEGQTFVKEVQKAVFCSNQKLSPAQEAHEIIEMVPQPGLLEFQSFQAIKADVLEA